MRERFPVRAHPLVFGVVVFLASELMFFAALFAAYYDLRNLAVGATPWPPSDVHLDMLDSSIGTLLLISSSGVMLLVGRAMDRGRIKAARAWLTVAVGCALAFIALSLDGYAHNSFGIGSSAYGSLFYTMTGFHLLHVAAGVVLLVALLLGLRSPALNANHRAGAEGMTYYWHFVLVVWLGIWGTIYLVR